MTTYYIFYKTTNLINNRFYYGVHTTNNKLDGYLGSGKLLKQAIKKYGKANFKKEIIFYADNLEELISFEEIVVDLKMVDNPNSYNLVLGGKGYQPKELHPLYGKKRCRKVVDKIIKSNTGKKRSKETIQKLSILAKGRKHTKEWKENHSKLMSTNHPFKDKKHKKESLNKMAKSKQSKYIGKFITPAGDFETIKEASEATKCSKKCIYNRCIYNCDKSVGFNRTTPKEFRGTHTWRSLGWYFISSGEV